MGNYFKNIYTGLKTISIGMTQTWRALFRPAITEQYPHERFEMFDNVRGILYNNVDDCIGCFKCARVCPVDCIYIDCVKAGPDEDLGKASTGNPIRQHVIRFDIDMFKCCYCDFCTTVCPTECLYMTSEYENSVFSRDNGIYHFSKYSKEEALALIKRDAEADMKKAKAKEAALAAKKAAAREKPVKKSAEETEKAVSTEGE